MKALLTLRLTVDHLDRYTPVFVFVKLYREADGLIWRLDGERGDPCQVLPRPPSVAQAKADARAVYPPHSPYRPRASWL